MRDLPEVPENNDALLGAGSKGDKEKRDHEDYNDFLKKKQALMSIPGLDLAQTEDESITEHWVGHMKQYWDAWREGG